MAHVYGSSGAYQISTAGHCGKTGDIATAIGFLGNRANTPVLLDFGKYSKSTGDAGRAGSVPFFSLVTITGYHVKPFFDTGP